MKMDDKPLVNWLQANVGKFTPLQQRLIRLRYGLDDGRRLSLPELSSELEMTVEEIRAEEREIIKLTRKILKSRS